MDIVYTTTSTDSDLYGILKLQRANLPGQLSQEEALEQGFVTVEHDLALLRKMHELHPHIIAVAENRVVGYALVMTRELRNDIPVLIPMFDEIDQLTFKGEPLRTANYCVMGQVCIEKGFRGKGVFHGMYEEMASVLRDSYALIITEVSLRNPRSVRAHEKEGYTGIRQYRSEAGEDWLILIKELSPQPLQS